MNTICVCIYTVCSWEKQTFLYFGAPKNVNFEFMQILDVDQIEGWFLQGYVLPRPPTGFRNVIVPCALIPVFLITDHSGGNSFLQLQLLTSVFSLLCMWIWGTQIFLLLFKRKIIKNAYNNVTESLENIEGKN